MPAFARSLCPLHEELLREAGCMLPQSATRTSCWKQCREY